MDKLRFGTAGIPLSVKVRDTINGIQKVRELNLDSFELEFVRNINIKKEKTSEVKDVAEKNNIVLTCHAPYYINLNSNDKQKLHASIDRILNSARIANLCNAWSVCFHAAYYMKESPEKVYAQVKNSIKYIVNILKKENNKIWIRPEVGGRVAQFGELQEIIKLSQEIEQVMPCVDFAHLHARSNGAYNTHKEFCNVLEDIEKNLGREALNNMHIHISGINYNEKGEKNHLILKNSDLNYKDLVKVWKDFKIKGVVISESPNIEEDAMLLKKLM